MQPYKGLAFGQVMFNVVHKGLRPDLPPDCPPAYLELMTACWADNEADRCVPASWFILEGFSIDALQDKSHASGKAFFTACNARRKFRAKVLRTAIR